MSEQERQLDDFLAEGLRLEDQGEYAAAMEAYRQAQERFPDAPAPVHRMGVMAIRMDDRDQARELFQQALTVHGDYAPALTNLGNMALEAGNVDEAIGLYKRAIAVQPEYPGAHHNLGVAYRRKGRLAEAVSEHRLATRHERKFSADMDKLRLRGSKHNSIASGCVGRGVGLLVFVSVGAYMALHMHL